jgi:uncharacterized membrane protein
MTTIEQSLNVAIEAQSAYDQWTRFEDFPRFMAGVLEVRRTGPGRLHWTAEVCGNHIEWDARVVEEIPAKKLAWRSEGELVNAGSVQFDSFGREETRVTLRIEYDPEALLQAMGYRLGAGPEQVLQDLECFKELAEDAHVRA